MLFLIQYDVGAGRLVQKREFDVAQRREAEDARLALELDLNRKGVRDEVVLLEAADEVALRLTHARYFEDLSEMFTRFESSTSSMVVRETKD